MKAKHQSKSAGQLSLNVEFGNVSLGKQNARIGVKISAADLTLTNAHRFFCGSRCEVHMQVDPQADDDADGQETLDGVDTVLELDAVADIKQFSVTPQEISFGLTFAKASVKIDDLSNFAQKTGTMTALRTGAVGDDKEAKGINPDQDETDEEAFDEIEAA